MTMEFAEYGIKYSETAKETRKKIPVEILPLLMEIESDLAENPKKWPERIIPAATSGKSFIYMHPSPAIQITFEIDSDKKILIFFHYAAPSLQTKKSLFISYSHKDKEWLDTKLRAFLSVLEQQGVIKFWDDEQIEPGKLWEEQILAALDLAVAGVLLVSQDFLASKFINGTELPKLLDDARKKGKRIFWLHVRPSTVFDTHQKITEYQSLQDDPHKALQELQDVEQDKALQLISKKLHAAMNLN